MLLAADSKVHRDYAKLQDRWDAYKTTDKLKLELADAVRAFLTNDVPKSDRSFKELWLAFCSNNTEKIREVSGHFSFSQVFNNLIKDTSNFAAKNPGYNVKTGKILPVTSALGTELGEMRTAAGGAGAPAPASSAPVEGGFYDVMMRTPVMHSSRTRAAPVSDGEKVV